MFDVHMLIPNKSNSGAVFAQAVHALFEARARALFNGYTQLPGVASGSWVDAETGVVFHDDLRIYFVIVSSILDGGKVGDLAAFAKKLYQQKAITIRYLGLSEIL